MRIELKDAKEFFENPQGALLNRIMPASDPFEMAARYIEYRLGVSRVELWKRLQQDGSYQIGNLNVITSSLDLSEIQALMAAEIVTEEGRVFVMSSMGATSEYDYSPHEVPKIEINFQEKRG